MAPRIRSFPRDQFISRVNHLSRPINAEALVDPAAASALRCAEINLHGSAGELAPSLDRRRCERGLRCDMRPDRLDHWLEDRNCDVAARRAAAQRAALTIGVVVAQPDRDRYIVGA